MNFPFADIKIVNKNKIYELNKIMLIRIPFFKSMLIGGFQEKDKNIIEIDVDEKYWVRVLNDIYNYRNIEIYKDFDINYIEFLKYLELDIDIEYFHEYLKVLICDAFDTDYPQTHKFSLDILEYIITIPKLRSILNTHCLNEYSPEQSSIEINVKKQKDDYPLTYIYIDVLKRHNMLEIEEKEKVYKLFFKDELQRLCNYENHYDLYKLMSYFNNIIEADFYIKNYKEILECIKYPKYDNKIICMYISMLDILKSKDIDCHNYILDFFHKHNIKY